MKDGAKNDRVAVAIRITLLRPPAGVSFCVQGRNQERLDRIESTGTDLSFDLTVLAARIGGKLRLFGDVTQGPPAARFVYVCSGTSAGQQESCWTRRAKVPLAGITWENVVELQDRPAARLEASFQGTAKDGGPSCATVPLQGAWRLLP
jgi:hypothetical protein